MTLKDFDPSHHARVKMRAKFTRYHPNLKSRLWGNRLDASIVRWCRRSYIPGLD